MSRYSKATKQIGDLWVDGLKRAENVVTSAARTRQAPTRRPAARTGLRQELPTLHEVVEANFDLAERVLKAQKHYALTAIEAAFPDAAKPAGAAHHAPARKPAARRRKRSTARAPRRTAAPA